MHGGAKISSVDVLKDFRAALLKFRAEAESALIGTEADIQRTLVWLRHDAAARWARQVRVKQELLTRAKSDLYRKQVAQDKEVRISVDQKKAVEKAKRELEHAEMKVESVRRWLRDLDKELVLYKGECQGLSGMLGADIPDAVRRLDGMIDALETYLSMAGPTSSGMKEATDEHHGGTGADAGRAEGTADEMGPGQGSLGGQ